MKFSEIDPEAWPELQPYLDTCLLPLSGLTGEESPCEAADKIAMTGLWLSPLEEAFRGRTVTMPAFHYESEGPDRIGRLNALISSWKRNGFRYVVLVSGQPLDLEGAKAELVIRPDAEGDEPDARSVAKLLADLWRSRPA
ncbi:DUF2487 family protein [Cohnella boryungensis]|uniref:DUF2487 family protein n=1 Tax=Cohnella boryungensis TaxID=768479 RepID=A0ABV8S684_9BACL